MTLKLLSGTVYGMAGIWGLFAFAWLFRDSKYALIYSIPSFGIAILLAVIAYYISRKMIWAWWLAVLFICAGIVGTIFDNIGWADIAFCAVSLIPLGVLLKGRKLLA